MAVNFPSLVYEPCFNVFARAVTFAPFASQPSQPNYVGRGIFNTVDMDVMAEDGSILSDQKTILDILEKEFTVLPEQRDQVIIAADGELPALGTFEIIDRNTNGGGETTLTLRRVLPKNP